MDPACNSTFGVVTPVEPYILTIQTVLGWGFWTRQIRSIDVVSSIKRSETQPKEA